MRPGVVGSAAIAGTKLSKPVPGTRFSGLHVVPSVDDVSTIVLPVAARPEGAVRPRDEQTPGSVDGRGRQRRRA